ncbi:MAG: hypothetical protein ACR2NZ_22850 [Rubripirellula sp.]
MWHRFVLVAVVAGLGLAYMSTSDAVPQERDQSSVASWRHLALADEGMEADDLAQQINQLGADGWQLVDVENFASKGETVKTVYYFKRPG